jgi:hypothetical protein
MGNEIGDVIWALDIVHLLGSKDMSINADSFFQGKIINKRMVVGCDVYDIEFDHGRISTGFFGHSLYPEIPPYIARYVNKKKRV